MTFLLTRKSQLILWWLRYNSPMNSQIKIALGLSGGVDSAVSAYLLKSEGYAVTGVHMQCWDYTSETCKGNEDRSDAVAICGQLDIKFKFLNFEKEYKSKVIDYFYSEYRAGRTPNPDVLCNKEIKFGLFLNWAVEQGFDYVATGHYARIAEGKDEIGFNLLKGVDEGKDQTYFLYRLTQEQLSKTKFPVGGLKKSEVRDIAVKNNLVVAKKAESMGICFVGEVDIRKFLEKEINPKKGDVVLKSTGEVIGTHEGVWFYTIGQRHGFEVKKYVGLPLYVAGKDVERNVLIVGYYNDCLVSDFEVSDIHFINGEPKKMPILCDVRIRHLGHFYPAEVSKSAGDKFKVHFLQSAFGVAPGQSAVFYLGDTVLGGGVIC